jgi:hypothetical protein
MNEMKRDFGSNENNGKKVAEEVRKFSVYSVNSVCSVISLQVFV